MNRSQQAHVDAPRRMPSAEKKFSALDQSARALDLFCLGTVNFTPNTHVQYLNEYRYFLELPFVLPL